MLLRCAPVLVTHAGKPMSKCGKCRRYMKYIAARPSRLYCAACEDVYALPQGGAVKQYKGLECPWMALSWCCSAWLAR